MKNLIALATSIILLYGKSFSQSYDTTNYYGKMNYVFHYVNKNQIATGLLRDYGIEFLNLDNYTGAVLHDSNFVSLNEWPIALHKPLQSANKQQCQYALLGYCK